MSISRNDGEDPQLFMNRCENDESMKAEYPNDDRRRDVCISKAVEDMGHIEAADFQVQAKKTYKYKDPKTGQVFEYNRRGIYRKDGRILVPVS